MDEQRFDDLTRSLASGNSRRGLLIGLLAGTVAGALAAPRGLRGLAFGGTSRVGAVGSLPQANVAGCGCDGTCDDGDPCTTSKCVDGTCVHEPKVCPDDGKACTKNVCKGGECVVQEIAGCCEPPAKACGESCCPPNHGCCKHGSEPECCPSDGYYCHALRGCVKKLPT